MKNIKLTKGAFAIVDDINYEKYSSKKWQFCNGYAVRFEKKNGLRKTIYLHKEIFPVPDGYEVDHINKNRLDNRIENLRKCTHAQNVRNRNMQSNNTSGFKGVSRSAYGRWVAKISYKGSDIHIGTFDSPEDAAMAYDEAARGLHGDFSSVNNKT